MTRILPGERGWEAPAPEYAPDDSPQRHRQPIAVRLCQKIARYLAMWTSVFRLLDSIRTNPFQLKLSVRFRAGLRVCEHHLSSWPLGYMAYYHVFTFVFASAWRMLFKNCAIFATVSDSANSMLLLVLVQDGSVQAISNRVVTLAVFGEAINDHFRSGPPLWNSYAAQELWLYAGSIGGAGTGHRREHSSLQRGLWRFAEAAAVRTG
jgi:hypothetical protein